MNRRVVPIVLAAQLAVLAIVLRAAGAAAHVPPAIDVELISAGQASGSMVELRFRITNWEEFPLQDERLWLEIYRIDGGRASSRPVTKKVLSSFCFRDYDGRRPRIYVVLTDIKSGATWKSGLIATAGEGKP